MTREEAIAVFNSLAIEMTAILAGIPKNESEAKQIQRYIDAYDMAISSLRQQEHKVVEIDQVKPLTLDELRQMDGEPVWVCFSGSIIYEDGWFIITEIEKCEVLLKGKVLVYKDFECYGKTWLAYRQKPEK